ncbi:MAG TPA: twin-arginine translocase TatA/TatE family subunit [Trueperaceae bacterium]|nr:twin-arginine translocase TatA/TatE family subunit [Trueperaceae bacterium]
MFGLQPIHIVVIIVLALLIFGPKRLPDFGKNLGRSIREFRQASKEMANDFQEASSEQSQEPKPEPANVPRENG